MPKCKFSEKVFEFNVNYEIAERLGRTGTTIFMPSALEEDELGYDARFQNTRMFKTLFLQYKVSDFITKTTGRYWEDYKKSYYDFGLHQDVNGEYKQHNKMCHLADDIGNSAYYCAPCFYEYSELVKHFQKHSVVANSIFIDCIDLYEISDKERHDITYLEDKSNVIQHSEPKKIEKICSIEGILEDILGKNGFSDAREMLLNVAEIAKVKIDSEKNNYKAYKKLSKRLKLDNNIDFILVGTN